MSMEKSRSNRNSNSQRPLVGPGHVVADGHEAAAIGRDTLRERNPSAMLAAVDLHDDHGLRGGGVAESRRDDPLGSDLVQVVNMAIQFHPQTDFRGAADLERGV